MTYIYLAVLVYIYLSVLYDETQVYHWCKYPTINNFINQQIITARIYMFRVNKHKILKNSNDYCFDHYLLLEKFTFCSCATIQTLNITYSRFLILVKENFNLQIRILYLYYAKFSHVILCINI